MESLQSYKRANFFPGLKATPAFWNEMEDYHFHKETLYNSLFHGYGIVPEYQQSLHVQAEKTRGGLITLLVGSGLAFDGFGRPIFLYKPQALVLDPKKFKIPCTVYVTICYNERMEDFYENPENYELQGYQHKEENSKVEILSEVTDYNSYVELARIRLEDPDGTGINEIKNNETFSNPGPNAIDFRFVPWINRVRKGISSYLLNHMINLFEYTESLGNAGYEVIQLTSLRNLQSVAMTSKMILQTTGVYFDDLINMIIPIFNMDHQVLFDIDEWEREHEAEGRLYTTKAVYEEARVAMYALGDLIKSYTGAYDEIDKILDTHNKVQNAACSSFRGRKIYSG